MEKEKKHIVLSTIVGRGLYEKVTDYCRANNMTPSSLIKMLLEEELTNKKSLTTIYNEIGEKFGEIERILKTIDKEIRKGAS
jgi:2-hydroxy-3-keto-5-methylthiopentenyl-1-phosphate phosphatase